MLRFYGPGLKSVMAESISTDKPVVLVKNNGVYLMVEAGEVADDGSLKHLVYAEGCNPSFAPQWQAMAQILVGKDSFTEKIFLTDGQRWDMINKSQQLAIVPEDTALKVFTGNPDYVPVAEYRNLTDRMNTMTMAHFNACVGPKELMNWREMAYRLFWKCRTVHCRRANNSDHYQFIMAVNHLHRRAQCVSPTGALLITH